MLLVTLFIAFHVTNCQEYDVLILGAGASGLGAAKYFYDHNMRNFLVLEGNDYIGGRMKNQMFGDVSVALGAGWIHLAEENHIFVKLANQYNLTRKLDNYNISGVVVRNETGSRYNQSEIVSRNRELNKYIDKMDELMEKRLEMRRGDVDLKAGLRMAGWRIETKYDEALEYYTFDFENAVEPDAISAVQYGMTASGEDYVVTDERGYAYGATEQTKPYRDKILLNQEIVSVKKVNKNKFDVSTKNGSKYSAKHVLVTFSSGVLNSRTVKFQPELPQWKYEALALAPMGHYCKMFLLFNEMFWDNSNYFLITTKFRGYYMHWQNIKIYNGKNMLLSIITGDMCKESHSKSDDTVKNEIYQVLKNVYENATMPTAILRNDWSTNKFFYGAYSTQIAGITTDDYLALVHPVNQSLWFAGEYTNGDMFGYTHGAYEMGEKIAKQIKVCMDDQTKCPSDVPKFTLQKTCTSAGGHFFPSSGIISAMFFMTVKYC